MLLLSRLFYSLSRCHPLSDSVQGLPLTFLRPTTSYIYTHTHMHTYTLILVSLFMIDPVGPMVQQKIDKRVTSCTHATQKRQSLLDNSQHSRVWVWRIVDQCLPASQITCRLGVSSAFASRLGSQHVLSTQHEQA